MEIKKIINGHEYTFEVPQNFIVAEEIKGNYDGYKIIHETNCYSSTLYKANTNFYEKKKMQNIGILVFNPETEKITLHKFVNDAEHKFLKSQSYGINNEIIKHLRTFDNIIIHNKKDKFFISVSKALKVGQYLHFDKYELQLFIPISEFTILKKKK